MVFSLKNNKVIEHNLNFFDKEFREKGDSRQAIGTSLYLPCLQYFLKFLPKESLVLDQGCGTGKITEMLLIEDHYVDCFDISSEAIKKCEEYFSLAGFDSSQYKLWVQDFNSFEYPQSKYDAIVDRYSLHFIPFEKQKRILKSVFKALKPGGIFHFSVLLDGSFKTWEYDIETTENGGLIFRRDEENEYRCFYLWDVISLRSILTSIGFKIKHFYHPMTYIEFVCQK